MSSFVIAPLWAVHIADNVLEPAWIIAGFILAGFLVFLGSRRVRDEEIPQIAVLSAVFFVASLIHIRVYPTSVHLLLNGLVGIVLGVRAALAIPLGIFLQAVLVQHGGFTTMGVNSCDMVLPALFVSGMFKFLNRLPLLHKSWFRAALVFVSIAAWLFCFLYGSILLLSTNESGPGRAQAIAFRPITIMVVLACAGIAAWIENRLESAPEFSLGLLSGVVAVLLTAFLTSLVLAYGGVEPERWRKLAQIMFVFHVPVAMIEGIVLGFTVTFLARVKPEMLGRSTLKSSK
jgi:ABC-type Co2+ transport system permease subunit